MVYRLEEDIWVVDIALVCCKEMDEQAAGVDKQVAEMENVAMVALCMDRAFFRTLQFACPERLML